MNKIDKTETMDQEDSGSEIKELLQKLSSWSKERQESQRLLDNLLNSYSGKFDKDVSGVSALKEEVRDLKAQLSLVSKQRNDLQETNTKLGSEIRQQRDKFALVKTLLETESEENQNKDNQEADGREEKNSDQKEHILGTPRKINETIDREEEKADYDNFEGRRLRDLNKYHSYDWDESNLSTDELTSVRKKQFKGEADLEEVTEDMVAEIDLDGRQENDFYERLSDRQRTIYKNMLKKRRPQEVETEMKQSEEKLEDSGDSPEQKHTSKAGDGEKFKCESCAYSTSNKKNFIAHKERVHDKIKNHSCECGYASHSKSDLKKHIEGVHAKIKHVCAECGNAFSQKGTLKDHMVSVHDLGDKKFECGSCPHTSASKKNMRAHTERVHEKMKNHTCEICDYATHSKSDLRKHIEGVHAKIKHVCTECGKAFSQKQSLNQHRASVHNIWDKKSIFCADCGYAATEKSSMEKHNEDFHKVQ